MNEKDEVIKKYTTNKINKAKKHGIRLIKIGYSYRKVITKIKQLYDLKDHDVEIIIRYFKAHKEEQATKYVK